MKINIEANYQDSRWQEELPEIQNITEKLLLESLQQSSKNLAAQYIELSLLLTDDENIHQLNKTYRNKDKATDVLSFPQSEPENIEQYEDLILGDIVVSFDTIKNDANDSNKNFYDHTLHILTHGILHLIGYDHEEDSEAEVMEKLEANILAKFNIKNPYAE